MGFYVYVLKSEASGRSYVGHSQHLEKRLAEHNSGKSIATRGKGPWKLVHSEEFPTRREAVLRERHLKSVAGRIKLRERGVLSFRGVLSGELSSLEVISFISLHAIDSLNVLCYVLLEVV